MKRKTRLAARLRSRAGESLGEVLISVLISAVALVMLISMLTSSTSLISKSKNRLETYYNGQSVLAAADAEGGISGTATFVNSDDYAQLIMDVDVEYYTEQAVNGTQLTTYRKAVPEP